MWLSSIIENTPPKWPTIPVCPQSWMLHRRMIWLPIFSFVHPSRCAWQIQSRSVCVPSLNFHLSHLLSLFGCLYFPSEMPEHFESEISQSFLICRRRSPLGCRLFYNKAGQRDITNALLRWIKAILAHINFHRFLIRVFPLEIHIENGLILLFVLLHIPGVNRECLIPGFFIDLRLVTSYIDFPFRYTSPVCAV